MKKFSDLVEERKYPDLNKRIPAFDYINDKGYVGPDYFITFTDLVKVGVNPHSEHNTPNGVYCFPSKILGTLGGAMYNVPYAKTAKYIHIIKIKSRHGVVDPLESYSSGDFKKDISKLKNFYKSRIPSFRDDEFDYMVSMGKVDSTHNFPFGWIWNITRLLSSDESLNIGLGWGGVKSGDFRDNEGNMVYRKGVQASAQGWSNLFRALGYTGFVDSGATGLIHANEPMQAVFIDPHAYSVVDMVLNKEYERSSKYEKVLSLIKELSVHNIIKMDNQFSHDTFMHDIFLKNFTGADLSGCRIDGDDTKIIVSNGNVYSGNFFGSSIIFSSCSLHGGNFERVSLYDCDNTGDSVIKNCDVMGGNV